MGRILDYMRRYNLITRVFKIEEEGRGIGKRDSELEERGRRNAKHKRLDLPLLF